MKRKFAETLADIKARDSATLSECAAAVADSMAREAVAQAVKTWIVGSVGARTYASNAGPLRVQAVWQTGAVVIDWFCNDLPITPGQARVLIAERIESLGGIPHASGLVTKAGK